MRSPFSTLRAALRQSVKVTLNVSVEPQRAFLRACAAAFLMAGSVVGIATGLAQSAVAPSGVSVAQSYGKLPLSFEANDGQTDPRVRFLSRGNGYSLFLTDSAAVLALRKPVDTGATSGTSRAPAYTTDVVRMELAGASRGHRVTGGGPLAGTANYFIGNDPSKWRSAVPTFAKVRYEGVYPGVDLVYYGSQGQLEYDFMVGPNANAKPIRLRFAGAKRLKLDEKGDLQVIGSKGEIAFHKPVVYQERDGVRQVVAGRFTLLSKDSVGFSLGGYDRSRVLVIDPVLAYSTYLGGSTGSLAKGIAVDASGSAYVIGETADSDFPVTSGVVQGANNATNGATNVFVTKLNAAGTGLVFSTYLGGTANSGSGDAGWAIAVDASGNSYLTGYTFSSDFPLKNAYQSVNKAVANQQASPFVAKLNATGTALVYSTYLGGSGYLYEYLQPLDSGDLGTGIVVNAAGNAYVAGATQSIDFPVTSGAYQPASNAAYGYGGNAFVTELSVDGGSLVYSTYLGGSGIVYDVTSAFIGAHGDTAEGIALDSAGNAYVTGIASSTDFPTTSGVLQPQNNGSGNKASNVFVAKLNATGSALIYSTYLGGSSTMTPNLNCGGCQFGDGGSSIAVDSAGDAYVAGATYSADFPTTAGAFQRVNHAAGVSGNAFAAKINPTATALVYSTLVGGSGSNGDIAFALALAPSGNLFLSGFTTSTNFPVTPDAFQGTNIAAGQGAPNAFLTELNASGTGLVYSTYLGGSLNASNDGDQGLAMALDSTGNAYVAGRATSADFPVTAGSYQITNNAPVSAFISKFGLAPGAGTATSTTLTTNINPQVAGSPVTFTAFVKASSGNGVPTGTVTGTFNGEPAGIFGTLDSTGHVGYMTTIPDPGTYNIIATYSGDANYASSSTSFTETIAAPVATPVISPTPGTYNAVQTVTITDATPGALIFVTTDGSTPGAGSGLYTGPITVSSSQTVQAVAYSSDLSIGSASASAAYVIDLATPAMGLGTISTFAGVGPAGYSGDHAPAISQELNSPQGVAVDKNGNVYIADTLNNRVRLVTPGGTIVTIAGTGIAGYTGDGGQATAAELNEPTGVAVDSDGTLYIADFSNNVVRKVTLDGVIGTVAGNGVQGNSGDGGPATSAEMYSPENILPDGNGNLYISDFFNDRVREVTAAGTIVAVAGNGTKGYAGDGGPATSAELKHPQGLRFDAAGNLYIVDGGNSAIRKIASDGTITTVAGTGTGGFSGDGGPATSAKLAYSGGIAFDKSGNFYIADYGNNRIRMVTPAGTISTVAGDGIAGFAGDGGPALSSEMYQPQDIVSDSNGNFYVADLANNRIRKLTVNNVALTDPGPFGNLEKAQDNLTQSTTVSQADELFVTGWVADLFDPAPLVDIMVMVDGPAVGRPAKMLRPDVSAALGNLAYLRSGYSLTYSAASMSVGTHSVTVVATDSRGLSTTFGPLSVTVVATAADTKAPFGNLERAADNVTGTTPVLKADGLFVSGWVVDPADGAPVANVEVYVDSVLAGAATTGVSRPDVASFYGNNAYTNSGYTFTTPASGLSVGKHMVTVVATDAEGLSTTFGPLSIKVVTPPVGNLERAIDSVTAQSTVSGGGTLYVGGWAADYLDDGPAKTVQIFIDAVSAGFVTLGQARPDVAAFYNNPAWSNTGYSFTYSVASLAPGSHSVAAVATDSLGLSTTFRPVVFTVAASSTAGSEASLIRTEVEDWTQSSSRDRRAAISAEPRLPAPVAVDASVDLSIAEESGNRDRKATDHGP